MSLNIPAINSIGTVQATDLMIAKDGVMKLYSDISGTHVYGDIMVDGNITNNNLQRQLDMKAPLNNPIFTGTIGRISKQMVNFSNVDDTSDLNKPISNATQDALNLKANNTEVDAKIANLVNSAPATLDTLNELARALGNYSNFSTSMTNLIGTKANQSTTYTKTEVDNNLLLKADQSTTYTKTEVDNSLLLKADQSTTYTKNVVDNSLLLK